ncbi:Yea4p, partial [Ascoidea rubescens DSM 1968]
MLKLNKTTPSTGSICFSSLLILVSQWLPITSLIFGGCCSNVFSLEKVYHELPNSSHLITFSQFLFIAVLGYFDNYDNNAGIKRLYLKQNHIPLSRNFINVLMFFVSSNLNNMALTYNISVPIHIIFRSSSTVITMIIGYLFANKRYNFKQIVSALILTFGIILATIGNYLNNKKKTSIDSLIDHDHLKSFYIGVFLLMSSSIIIAFNGLFTERTYKIYGKYWQESLFYQHFLGLPIFIIFQRQLVEEYKQMMYQKETFAFKIPVMFSQDFVQLRISKSLCYLLLNCFTQNVCITGVNKLASITNALTVSIVLLIRKFVSLLLSVLIFGNLLHRLCLAGSFFVFTGAGLYSFATKSSKRSSK